MKTSKKDRCIVYGAVKPSRCLDPKCGQGKLIKETRKLLSRKKNEYTLEVLRCPECGLIYVSYSTFTRRPSQFKCINKDQLDTFKMEREAQKEKREEKGRQIVEEAKREYQESKLAAMKEREAAKKAAEEQRKAMLDRKNRFIEVAIAKREKAAREKAERERLEYKKREKELQKKLNASKKDENPNGTLMQNRDDSIHVQDFVVRRNIFRCRHQEHVLRNIDAKIDIIGRGGEVFTRTIPAGYCASCNTFFIMESTYQDLRKYGTPICRISDERSYLTEETPQNGMRLAQQSILMQYGYSVSQEEDLSTIQRRKILSLIVDNGILTRSEIIGYLDFFISQRESRKQYSQAVDKWERDREYIAKYNTGTYTKYGVGGLHRK